MILSALDDAVDGFFESQIGGVDNQVRDLAIETFAEIHKTAQFLGAVFHVDKRAIAAAAEAAGQAFDVGGEPDDETESADSGAIFGAKHDASACRDHVKVEALERREHCRFPFAEARLSLLRKDLGDAHPALLDNQFVGIKNLKSKTRGDFFGDGGLPATHHADQQNIPRAGRRSGRSRHVRANRGVKVDG